MKILAGSFQCESNTFSGKRAVKEDFEVYRGEGVLAKLAAVKIFQESGAKVQPLLFASALPSGMVTKEAFEYYKEEFLDIIRQHKDADGIYLYLHGSMYVESIGSGEEALVKAIREEIGSHIPISTALDFHANLPDGFLENVNAVHGFRTAPHIDHDDTEQRAAKALLKCIRYRVTPVPKWIRIPFLGGDASVTDRGPFPAITEKMQQLDERKEIISGAFFNGQPWYDADYAGNCAVVSGLWDTAKAEAMDLAKLFWEGRDLLTLAGAMTADAAVKASLDQTEGILFVTDSGDNTTAGADGAGTLLLNKYIKQGAKNVLVCGILDAAAVGELLEKQPGEPADIILCKGMEGKQTIETKLHVTLKSKGTVYGWAGDEVGQGVVVTLGGIDIALTNARAAFTTLEHFGRMQIVPDDYRVIVLKMGYLFPKLKQISEKTIFALTPGMSTNDFTQLDYQRLKHKMYPIDKDITWEDIEAENLEK